MKNHPTSFHFPTQRLLQLFQRNKKGEVISFSSLHLWRSPGYFISNIIYCSNFKQEKVRAWISIFSHLTHFVTNHKNILKPICIQGVPKGSGRFFKNGCGIQISQATPTNFFLSIIMANFSENLVTIASIFPLYMALLDGETTTIQVFDHMTKNLDGKNHYHPSF